MKPKLKSVNELICETSSETFREYWKEMRRHENALRRIYGKDKKHICVPEIIGCMSQLSDSPRVMVEFRRCAVCMKDLPPERASGRESLPKFLKRLDRFKSQSGKIRLVAK